MYTKVKPFLLHAMSSIHAGSGTELGLIDNPVQREVHTGYPKIESSSLKGAIRSTVSQYISVNGNEEDEDAIIKIFGSKPGENENSSQAGAIAFADARLLLFPVKSLRGTFAYITCKGVLERFNRELNSYLYSIESNSNPFQLVVPNKNTVSSDKILVSNKENVILGEYTYKVEKSDETKKLAEQLGKIIFCENSELLSDRLVVLDDNDFADFVRLSMEVNARIRIDQKTGIVAKGALFYEENVPPEAVFYSFLFAGRVREEKHDKEELSTAEDVLEKMADEQFFPTVFQLGGSSTLGHGMLKRLWIESEGGDEDVN